MKLKYFFTCFVILLNSISEIENQRIFNFERRSIKPFYIKSLNTQKSFLNNFKKTLPILNNVYLENSIFNLIKRKRSSDNSILSAMNKEIIKNQLISYESFLNNFKKINNFVVPVENRQIVTLVRTLFRFPVLLLFSNLFQLPLIPTLILASPFLNKNDLPSETTQSVSPQNTNFLSSLTNPSHSPLSLNPLQPINQLLNNFIGELISDFQNSPAINSFIQNLANTLTNKPNRVGLAQNQQYSQFSNQTNSKPNDNSMKVINLNNSDSILSNSSNINLTIQQPPVLINTSLPNLPLIGPVPADINQAGGGILNSLASSLLETNKNHQITETLGIDNAGTVPEMALNAVNTLATMLRIKKQRKELNSNEDFLLNLLTSKNYLQEIVSVAKLLKQGLKRKRENKDLDLCLIKTICESNQRQISFAFDKLFSLAMQLTGMESRIEHSPYHHFYKVGRKLINERNICEIIPKCDSLNENFDLSNIKSNLKDKISTARKLEKVFGKNILRPENFLRKVRRVSKTKYLVHRSLKRIDKLSSKLLKFL